MWLTFGLTLLISAAWAGKMIIQRRVVIQKTPLDMPILLFLLSQLLSTIFSMDVHTSIWGYYSRFNGGFLSLLTYAFLYYAFVTNIAKQDLLKHLFVSIGSGVVVALWGLPSHFGYDPTCLLFRGTFDVSCWTSAFQPKVRIFSTMGQPDWLAAYLVYLLPLTTAFTLFYAKKKHILLYSLFLLLTALFYVDLLYTGARSGMIGMAVSLGMFFAYYAFINKEYLVTLLKNPLTILVKSLYTIVLLGSLVLFTFFISTPFSQLSFFTPAGVAKLFVHKQVAPSSPVVSAKKATPAAPVGELGGTDSGKIRLYVWQGAWQIFLHHPIFGTGVETFAFAYYQYRPVGHNLTSEWDYLYNKAHNEFLNYLATTGGLGFLTYVAMLGYGLWVMCYGLQKKEQSAPALKTNNQNSSALTITPTSSLITASLIAAYISILVTNFFGFSVVIMNIFLFLTPAFVFYLEDTLHPESVWAYPTSGRVYKRVNELQWILLGGVALVTCYFLIVLVRFWLADTSYALGQNFDHVNEYQAAYSYLHDAVATRPSEPVFQDELSVNDAVLAAALIQQKDTQNGSRLAQEALQVSDVIVRDHPNVVTYWKTRVRVLYALSQVNPQLLAPALQAIQKAHDLAPTDAKVSYNLALLYAQNDNLAKAVDVLNQTVQLKPDYRDAWYALGLYEHQLAIDKNGQVTDPAMEANAVKTMHFIMDRMDQDGNLKIPATLKSWKEE